MKENLKKDPPPTLTPLSPPPTIKKSRFTIRHRRSVSFGQVSERLFSQEQYQAMPTEEPIEEVATKVIEFDSLASDKDLPCNTNSNFPAHPGDLLRLYGPVKSPIHEGGKKTPKKSILRTESKYGPLLPKDKSRLQSVPTLSKVPEIKVQAVSDAVVERQVTKDKQTNIPAMTKMAVSDTVVERQPPAFNNPSDDGGSMTQKFSRFRATRVYNK